MQQWLADSKTTSRDTCEHSAHWTPADQGLLSDFPNFLIAYHKQQLHEHISPHLNSKAKAFIWRKMGSLWKQGMLI
jgi:hypothetical protein